MKVIHISDVHFNKQAIEPFKLRILPGLITDIKKLVLDINDTIIIFSGDLIDKGGAGYKNIDEAFQSFKENILLPLSSELGMKENNIFFAPGNHDVSKDMDDHFEQVGLDSTLDDEIKLSEFQKKDSKKGYSRIIPFKNFENEYYSSTAESIVSNFETYHRRKLGKKKIGILCLNSSWHSYDSKTDLGNLLVGERQILQHKNEFKKRDINIGVIHHHTDWIKAFDKDTIVPLIEKNLDILFCGHVHQATSYQKTGIYGSLLSVVSPSTWVLNIHSKETDFCVGYQIVDIQEIDVEINYRRYSVNKDEFVPDVEHGDETGKIIYQLPMTEDKKLFSAELEVSTRIKDVYVPMSSEHLLNYNTDSISPTDIDDIFVEPKIIEKITVDENGEEDESIVTIDDLLDLQSNTILFGIKESGKSIILDKLLSEFSSKIANFRRVPILLDFNKITSSSIRTSISRFLSVGIREIDEYIKTHKIILMIDDVDFSDSNREKLKMISNFISENNILTLLTSTNTSEKELSVEYIHNEYFKVFNKMFITSYKTKQIRELTSKWFSSNTEYYSEERINNIIKMIVALNLPRTPLSISMFLWIIEKQESFVPINQANMLDTFIEKLFEKHSDKESLSSNFNYRNKITLLAEIAHHMYNVGNENYSLHYTELLLFIKERLDAKQFKLNSQSILDHFVDKGIFSKKENCSSDDVLTFRFNCFFEYFLMQKMVLDEEFKGYVLDPENYYYFENEIDYFTGLRRYDKDILSLVTDRIHDELSGAIEQANALEFGFDSFFHNPKQATVAEKTDSKEVVRSLSSTPKPTESDLDEFKDQLLESIISEQGIPEKHRKLHPLHIVEKKISIALSVLKNSEEISDKELKNESFKKALECVAIFACIYKAYLTEVVKNKEKQKDKNAIEELKFSLRLLPLFVQEWLLEYVGTKKLETVIQNYFDALIKEKKTELEKFLVAFLFADLNGEKYHKKISTLIKSVKRKFVLDMILIKLVSYYFLRAKTEEDERVYLDLIAEVIIKAKRLPKGRKGSIIQLYIDLKKKRNRKAVPAVEQ